MGKVLPHAGKNTSLNAVFIYRRLAKLCHTRREKTFECHAHSLTSSFRKIFFCSTHSSAWSSLQSPVTYRENPSKGNVESSRSSSRKKVLSHTAEIPQNVMLIHRDPLLEKVLSHTAQIPQNVMLIHRDLFSKTFCHIQSNAL